MHMSLYTVITWPTLPGVLLFTCSLTDDKGKVSRESLSNNINSRHATHSSGTVDTEVLHSTMYEVGTVPFPPQYNQVHSTYIPETVHQVPYVPGTSSVSTREPLSNVPCTYHIGIYIVVL